LVLPAFLCGLPWCESVQLRIRLRTLEGEVVNAKENLVLPARQSRMLAFHINNNKRTLQLPGGKPQLMACQPSHLVLQEQTCGLHDWDN